MSDPLRIFLRVVGVVLFVGGLAGVAFIVAVGPDEVGRSMGQECRHNDELGPADYCTWQDVLGIMQALPWITLVGAGLMILLRPDGVARFNRLRGAATAAVVAIVVVNLVGVFIYRHSYTVVHTVDVAKKIARDASAKPADTGAPRGLAKGSLLEEDAFSSAMADIRRAAPTGASLSGLYVSAERIEAQALSGGKVTTLRKPYNGKVAVVGTKPAGALDGKMTTFAKLDPAAPQRVAMAEKNVTYLVLFDAAGLQWNVSLKDGKTQLKAAPDGRGLKDL